MNLWCMFHHQVAKSIIFPWKYESITRKGHIVFKSSRNLGNNWNWRWLEMFVPSPSWPYWLFYWRMFHHQVDHFHFFPFHERITEQLLESNLRRGHTGYTGTGREILFRFPEMDHVILYIIGLFLKKKTTWFGRNSVEVFINKTMGSGISAEELEAEHTYKVPMPIELVKSVIG